MNREKPNMGMNDPFFDGFNHNGSNLGDSIRNTFNAAITTEISQLQVLQHDMAQPDFAFGQPEDHNPVARDFLKRMLEGLVGALAFIDAESKKKEEGA